jgi:hypothetical protein
MFVCFGRQRGIITDHVETAASAVGAAVPTWLVPPLHERDARAHIVQARQPWSTHELRSNAIGQRVVVIARVLTQT